MPSSSIPSKYNATCNWQKEGWRNGQKVKILRFNEPTHSHTCQERAYGSEHGYGNTLDSGSYDNNHELYSILSPQRAKFTRHHFCKWRPGSYVAEEKIHSKSESRPVESVRERVWVLGKDSRF
jgi:hypothetical protein